MSALAKRPLTIALAAVAIAAALFAALTRAAPNPLPMAMAFPYAPIALGLRALSLSGAVGNVAAFALLIALCLLPLAYLAHRLRTRRARAEDALLALYAAAVCAALYLLINPGDIVRHFGVPELFPMHKAMLGLTANAIAVGYLLLRALRYLSNVSAAVALSRLRLLLLATCVVLVLAVFGKGLSDLLRAIDRLRTSNTMPGQALGASTAFLSLHAAVNALPPLFGIAMIYVGLDLLDALQADPYGEAISLHARRLGRVCRASIAAVLLSQIALNVLQLAFGSSVLMTNITLTVPLASIAFSLAVLFLASYFDGVRSLKRDNDAFI